MIKLTFGKPSVEEFEFLTTSVGWNLKERGITLKRMAASIDKSPLCVLAYDEDKLIGMVRISGDLEMYGYIQDAIVHPDYQGKGIGSKMLSNLLDKLKGNEGYLLGVCPSKVSLKLYGKFGFIKRPENPNGFMNLKF